MTFLNSVIDYLQSKFPVNRVVVLLTPVFAALSGFVVAWVAQHFPGLPVFSQGEVTAFLVAGAAAGLAAAYKWIDGWQKHEARVHETTGQPVS